MTILSPDMRRMRDEAERRNKKPWLPEPGDPVIDVDVLYIEDVEWVPFVCIPMLNTAEKQAVLPRLRGRPTREEAFREARKGLQMLKDGVASAMVRLDEMQRQVS